jgi:mannose-6-phosphate isomerase-like protein (cupin superfamily)
VKVKRRPHHREGEVDYVYESIEPKNPHKHMEPFLVEFQPMETGEMVFMSHEGEEFHFVLEGRLEFRTDDRVEVLYPGLPLLRVGDEPQLPVAGHETGPGPRRGVEPAGLTL